MIKMTRSGFDMPNVITINRPDVIALIEQAARKLTGGNKTEAVALALRRSWTKTPGRDLCSGASGIRPTPRGCRSDSARSRYSAGCRDRPRDRPVTDALLLDTHIARWLALRKAISFIVSKLAIPRIGC
jgi:hypothetical protein